MSVLLVTFLSCSQVQSIVNRLQNNAIFSPEQKIAIVEELKTAVPTCPVIIKNK
jgi:hypothetical protein